MKTTNKIFPMALACGLATTTTLNAQNLYVANSHTGTLGEYGLDGSTVNASLISGLGDSIGLAISGNDVFV